MLTHGIEVHHLTVQVLEKQRIPPAIENSLSGVNSRFHMNKIDQDRDRVLRWISVILDEIEEIPAVRMKISNPNLLSLNPTTRAVQGRVNPTHYSELDQDQKRSRSIVCTSTPMNLQYTKYAFLFIVSNEFVTKYDAQWRC